MTLEDVGNTGELIGAIAVLITLVYLAIQLRQNTRALHAQTYQDVYRDLRDNLSSIDTDIAPRVGANGKLIASDEARIGLYEIISLRAYENWWNQCRYGTTPEDVFRAYISHMRKTLEPTDAKIWFRRVQTTHDFTPGFIAFVEEYMRNQDPESHQDA